jgi:hypothetical protein
LGATSASMQTATNTPPTIASAAMPTTKSVITIWHYHEPRRWRPVRHSRQRASGSGAELQPCWLYPLTPWSTPVDRRVGCPSKDRVNLIPDGLPLGALTSEVEFGQHAFEPIDHFRAALKPWISATLFKKGFNLVHHALPAVLPMSHHRWAIRVLDLQPLG